MLALQKRKFVPFLIGQYHFLNGLETIAFLQYMNNDIHLDIFY